jgi:hypothetical protein
MRWHDAATYLEWRRCFHADRRKRTESELVVGKDGAWVVWASQSDVQSVAPCAGAVLGAVLGAMLLVLLCGDGVGRRS